MATEIFDVILRVRGVNEGTSSFDALEKKMTGVRTALGFLRSALVVFASIRAFSGLVTLLDTFTEITTKIKLVTSSVQELNGVTQELYNVSQRTRTSFEANVSLFNRVARATSFLNLTYGQLISVSETVAQLIKISGANAQESSGALIQFSQALASNRLSGDELRTVLEQFPALADVIGKKFGVAGAALRAIANNNPGIITTQKIIEALKDSVQETADRFSKTVPTIAEGFIKLHNALVLFLGRLNQAGDVGATLFNVLSKLADNIDLIVVSLLVLASIASFNFLTNQVARFVASLAFAGATTLHFVEFLAGGIINLARAFGILAVEILAVFTGNATTAFAQGMVAAVRSIGVAIIATSIALARFAVVAATAIPAFIFNVISATVAMVQFGATAAASFALAAGSAALAAIEGFVSLLAAIDAAVLGLVAFSKRLVIIIGLGFETAISTLAASFGRLAVAIGLGALSLARFVGQLALTAAIGGAVLLFNLLSGAVLAASRAFIGLSIAVLTNPLVIGGVAIIAGLIIVWELFGDSIKRLIARFGTLREIANKVLAFLQTAGTLLFTQFDLIWKAIQESAFDAFQSIKKAFADFLDFVSSGLKHISFGHLDLGQFNFEKPRSEFAGAGAELARLFSDKFEENLKADPLQKIEDAGKKALDFIHGLLTGSADFGSIKDLKPPGSPFGAPSTVDENKVNSLKQRIENMLQSISPFFDAVAKVDQAKKVFDDLAIAGGNAADLLAKAGLTAEEVFRRLERSETGVGNATVFYTERLKVLRDELQRTIITQEEFGQQALKARKDFLEAQHDLASGTELGLVNIQELLSDGVSIGSSVVEQANSAATAIQLFRLQQEALAIAIKNGTVAQREQVRVLTDLRIASLEAQHDLASGIELALLNNQKALLNEKDIASSTIQNATAGRQALAIFAVQQNVLNEAVGRGIITNTEYEQTWRKLRETALQSQTDMASGFETAMLQIKDEIEDVASNVKKTFLDAFHDMSDALVTFLDTGRLNFGKFVDDIFHNLHKLAVQKFVEPLLQKGLEKVGSFFGLDLSKPKALGETPQTAMWVRFASGAPGQAPGTGGLEGLVGDFLGNGLPATFDKATGVWTPGSEGFPEAEADHFLQRFGDTFTSGTGGGGFLSRLGSAIGGLFGGGFGASAGSGFGNLLSKGIGLIAGLAGGGGGGPDAFGQAFQAQEAAGFAGEFAGGGRFVVGGKHGTDANLIAMRVTRGEEVSVTPPGQSSGGTQQKVINLGGVHFNGIRDFNGFKKSEGQALARVAAAVARASARTS